MNTDINLALPAIDKKKQNNLVKQLFIVFALVVIVGIGIFVYSLFITGEFNALVAQENSYNAALAQSAVKKEKILTVSQKLNAIRTIINSRNSVNDTANKILAIIPSNFSIDAINADNQRIMVGITSSDLSSFADFLSQKLPQFIGSNKSLFSTVQVDAFSQSGGGYSLNLTFNMKGALKQSE